MCGAFAATCRARPAGLPLWHAGRLTGYAMLGALAASFGHLVRGPAWIPAAFATLFLLWFALALGGVVRDLPSLPAPFERAASRTLANPGARASALFGLLNGFLPCGLVYAALSVPIAVADPLLGGALMLAFGLGTVPALTVAASGVQRLLLNSLGRRRALALVLLVVGLWAIWVRASDRPHQHHQMPEVSLQRGVMLGESR